VTVTVYKGGSVSIPVTLIVASATTTTSPPTTTNTAASLSWSPPDVSTGVAGYKVYMGSSAGAYGPPFTVGNVTSYVFNNLAVGTYYFVVTTYDGTGAESLPSNEVSKSVY
jgi:hypothetical protein